MNTLLIPISACLLLTSCALPLMQAAGSQMMTTPAGCGVGAGCSADFGGQIAKAVGSSLQQFTGLTSVNQITPK